MGGSAVRKFTALSSQCSKVFLPHCPPDISTVYTPNTTLHIVYLQIQYIQMPKADLSMWRGPLSSPALFIEEEDASNLLQCGCRCRRRPGGPRLIVAFKSAGTGTSGFSDWSPPVPWDCHCHFYSFSTQILLLLAFWLFRLCLLLLVFIAVL